MRRTATQPFNTNERLQTKLEELSTKVRELMALAGATHHPHAQARATHAGSSRSHRDALAALRTFPAVMTLEEDETRELSQVLHRSTMQLLASLAMNLDVIAATVIVMNARSRALLEESRLLVRRCFEDVRTVADRLYPPLLEESGLALTLEYVVRSLALRGGVEVDLKVHGAARASREIELTVFQLIEHYVTGSARQSIRAVVISLYLRTSRIELEMTQQPERTTTVGSPSSAASPGPDNRLRQLRRHVLRLGGSFVKDRTTIRVQIPAAAGQLRA